MQSKHIEGAKKNTVTNIANRRFARNVKRKRKKKLKKRKHEENILRNKLVFEKKSLTLETLPSNLKYLIACKDSCFHIDRLYNLNYKHKNGVFLVPKTFSLLEQPKEAFKFMQELTAVLIFQKHSLIRIDYSNCIKIELGAQVFLDVILREFITHYNKNIHTNKIKEIRGVNINNTRDEVKKLLFSVGSPAIHSNKSIVFKDIVPYKLCVHNRESNADPLKIMEKKDIDTTELVDYVLDSLNRLNIQLSAEQIDSLCTVVGEILINAEEHSTTKYRFSIGYFQEKNVEGKHFGIFKLVIFNLGKTIYEKFKYNDDTNLEIVAKMKALSTHYTEKKYFFKRKFEEDTLWTLYSLQEGVTSVKTSSYRKRGNGSIQFIENFFNLSDTVPQSDYKSKLSILSGHTHISFDGQYGIIEKEVKNEKFKYMTFNSTGNIEELPDNNCVFKNEHYFPGTLISAEIFFNEKQY